MEDHFCRNGTNNDENRPLRSGLYFYNMQVAFLAQQIFTGEELLKEKAIIVNNGVIEDIVPKQEVNMNIKLEDLKEHSLFPAFIDSQVYGAGGRLLAVFPDSLTLKLMHSEF